MMLGLSVGLGARRRKLASALPSIVPGLLEQDLTAWTQVRLTTATATLPATLAESTDGADTNHYIQSTPTQGAAQYTLEVDYVPASGRYLELRAENNDFAVVFDHTSGVTTTVSGSPDAASVVSAGPGKYRATLTYTHSGAAGAGQRVRFAINDAGDASDFYSGDGRDAVTIHAMGLNAA